MVDLAPLSERFRPAAVSVGRSCCYSMRSAKEAPSERSSVFQTLFLLWDAAGGRGTIRRIRQHASLSALGYKSPNEKLNIGAVGVGVRGPAILVGAAATENIVALCDVDEERSARGFAQYPERQEVQRLSQDVRNRGQEPRRGNDRDPRSYAHADRACWPCSTASTFTARSL